MKTAMTKPGQSVILLLAHGTPNVLGEMKEYLDKVTGGRGVPPQVVEELQHRYAEIGLREVPGTEPPPLTRWTLKQAELLEHAACTTVYVGMRNWHPYIADTVAQMKADGVSHAKVICLAPQNSRTSIGLYKAALLKAVEDSFTLDFVEGWHDEPKLIEAFAERLRPVLAKAAPGTRVLFTAHSVPCRTISTGAASVVGARPGTPEQNTPDTYAVEAKQTAALVAKKLGLSDSAWLFAFQSQGVSGGPWIGPSVEDTLKALKEEGATSVILHPIGFVCDHVEVLYDIDIAFTQTARELGMQLDRAESLNDSPLLIEALDHVLYGEQALSHTS
jgi:protoporphyrin/coproporphyrin ferrochelatase